MARTCSTHSVKGKKGPHLRAKRANEGTHKKVRGAEVASAGGSMDPLPATKLNATVLSARTVGFRVVVSTYSDGPPVSAYETPASTGNATPPLKSATVTPVTGVSNVAVAVMTLSNKAPEPSAEASVTVAGLTVGWRMGGCERVLELAMSG